LPMRMRTTLLLSLLSVSLGVASLTLIIVHTVLQKQIRQDIGAGLERSITTYRNIQAQQQQTLRHEVSLVAALPPLKSLMTTADPKTIRDGASTYFRLSGGDLFSLADPGGNAIALFENGVSDGDGTPRVFIPPSAFASGGEHFLLLQGRLYTVAAEPIYFGSAASGSSLGYVLLGYAVNNRVAQEVKQVAAAEVVFCADRAPVASTLHQSFPHGFFSRLPTPDASGNRDIWLGREHFVGAAATLSGADDPAVQLVVLESYDQASRYLTQLNRVMLVLAAFLLALSGLLAIYLSTTITRPLDRLVAGARALGAGNFEYQFHRGGAREIRELGDAFDRMRHRLREAQQELLAAERLATIGQMASSISHDLRHYLSAVYANAEFLGYDKLDAQERLELLGEIRQGVRGMTDLIESLLLFSRTGQSLQFSWESLPVLVERSVALVRAHPEAQNVNFVLDPMAPIEARVDPLKIERAIYNLVLNGCQAARQGSPNPQIRISLAEESDSINLRVIDNGPGVPDSIRVALFRPFVSEGKPSGMGLGLALSYKIAQEHGGSVSLEESRPGYTVFRFSLSKPRLRQFAAAAESPETRVTTE
jgi:signal transduction histidine kinase